VNKKSAALARIRQISHLALPGEIFIPAAIHELSRLVPGAAAAFFWLDAHGRISNCYAPRLPDRADGFAQLGAEQPTAVQVLETNAAFYRRVLEVNGARDEVHSDVAAGGATRGRLYIYRREGERPLTARERGDVEAATRYFGRGLAAQAAAEAFDANVTAMSREELLICDPAGRIVQASAGGRSLMLLAAGVAISPGTMSLAFERSNELLRSMCTMSPRGDTPRPRHVAVNAWGRFSLEVVGLPDGASSRAPFFAIQLKQHKPASLHFLDAMGRTGLSSRQREIALMVTAGLGNRAIAEALELSVNTVAYHMKCVFQKLGVRTRRTLVTRLMHAESAI